MSEHTKGTYMTVTQIMAECAALHRELAAARALLREVLAEVDNMNTFYVISVDLFNRSKSYLDACDTLGSGNG